MTNPAEAQAGALETAKDAGKGNRGLVQRWLMELALAEEHEKEWREAAADAVCVYRDEGREGKPGYRKSGSVLLGGRAPSNRFNILYSNIQTICPALYNVTPRPDVRRRYRDRDPVGKEVSTVVERALSFSMDVYDFHQRMKMAVKDMQLVGRGITRVRYKPYFTDGEKGEKEATEKPEPQLAYEAVCCEHVPYKDFRMGPGRTWDDVPWIAFGPHLLRKEQVKKFFGSEIAEDVVYDYTPSGVDDGTAEGRTDVLDVFKRCRVWEIWDREKRQVVWLSPSLKHKPLRVDDDPYNLENFYPIPRPLYAVDTTDTLIPVEPFRYYREQAIELDRLTKRIENIVSACIAAGVFDSRIAKELEKAIDAGDNAFIPAEDVAALVANGGIENSIWMWPVEKIAAALVYLYQQREALKQTIYEITGIADIMRGATDARETLGSQRLKAQFGTMRIDEQKREVERYARDLVRLKAELIAEKFGVQTLQLMTGVDLPFAEQKQAAQMQAQRMVQQQQPVPPQLQKVLSKPTWEDAVRIMRDDGQRGFRIDIETDQSVASDDLEEKKAVNEFITGLSGFISGVGPVVEAAPELRGPLLKVMLAAMRRFKFGREVEDAFDALSGEDNEQPPQQAQPKPDPEAIKAQAEQQKAAAELQLKQQEAQMKMQIEQQKLELERAKADAQIQLEREKAAAQAQIEQMKAENEIQLSRVRQQTDSEIARFKAEQQAATQREAARNRPRERKAA